MDRNIEQYLEMRGLCCDCASWDVRRFRMETGRDSRLAGCMLVLRAGAAEIHVSVELPVTVRRGEISRVLCQLDCINDELKDGCYTVDPLNGVLNYVFAGTVPDSPEGVGDIVDRCIKTVEEDFTTVMQLVINEIIRIENEAVDSPGGRNRPSGQICCLP